MKTAAEVARARSRAGYTSRAWLTSTYGGDPHPRSSAVIPSAQRDHGRRTEGPHPEAKEGSRSWVAQLDPHGFGVGKEVRKRPVPLPHEGAKSRWGEERKASFHQDIFHVRTVARRVSCSTR